MTGDHLGHEDLSPVVRGYVRCLPHGGYRFRLSSGSWTGSSPSRGNTLTMFVEKYPEKRAYFELSNGTIKFAFSEPGLLEDVRSRSKVVLRMTSVDFQYPSKRSAAWRSLVQPVQKSPRVIKGLVGEQLPTSGSIWKAAGLRLAQIV